jgi:hypothetical protein
MASIRSLNYYNWSSLGIGNVGSANGLVLGNKEGFYRDLGADIFTNNDYVRVAIWYSINLNSDPNATTGVTSEFVTNYNPYDYFYCGLKTPNANFPDAAQAQSKFCGYYMPPRINNTGSLNFTGIYSTGPSTAGFWANQQNSENTIIFGNLTTPYAQNMFTTTNLFNLSTNRIKTHGTGMNVASNNQGGIGVLGLELRDDNTMLGNYSTQVSPSTTGIQGPGSNFALSAMKTYVNNQSFLSNSIDLAASAPYGQATAMFMYNPFVTNCIRVHGMIAAGFTR